MSRAENITPSILIWARETAGFSVEEAAALLGLTSSTRSSATEKLEAFERGDVKPTRNQLLKISAKYRRPLTAFYRSTPPKLGDRGEDFRTLPGGISNKESALLDALLRNIRARQDMVKSILEDDEDAHPLAIVGSTSVTLSILDAVKRIRQVLGIGENLGLQSRLNSPNQLFNKLREKVENVGVFVLLVGDLGSYHSSISERVFRGFAIADDIAPFIVINAQDAIAARSFTMLHELVHIFTGSTGVSDAPSISTPTTQSARVERFCNDVASEFLLPQKSLDDLYGFETSDSAARVINDVASKWKISEAMVAYRLWRTRRIEAHIYHQLMASYVARWQDAKEKRRERARQEDASGPTYYTVRKHRLGNALIKLVGRTLRANELTHTKAAKMLGVKPSSVEPLLKGVETVSGSYPSERI